MFAFSLHTCYTLLEAIVPQDTLLFGGSIRENILYGRLDASEADLVAAAQAANAHDFILALPQQYETIVGERGAKLKRGFWS